MGLETSEERAETEQTDFQMPSLADDDLLHGELLEYALGESDPASAATAEAHLADCLLCRIRLNRIKIDDPRLEPPAFAVSHPPVSEEALKLLAAHPPARIESDQVWYARGEHSQLMVWVSHEPIGFDAVIAHPVTTNIDAVGPNALIVDLPKIGPVAVFSSIIGLALKIQARGPPRRSRHRIRPPADLQRRPIRPQNRPPDHRPQRRAARVRHVSRRPTRRPIPDHRKPRRGRRQPRSRRSPRSTPTRDRMSLPRGGGNSSPGGLRGRELQPLPGIRSSGRPLQPLPLGWGHCPMRGHRSQGRQALRLELPCWTVAGIIETSQII